MCAMPGRFRRRSNAPGRPATRPQVVVPAAGIARIAPFEELAPEALARVDRDQSAGRAFPLPSLSSRPARTQRTSVRPAVGGRQARFCRLVDLRASKWGLRGAVAALREELAGTPVRLTEIYPGATDSPLWEGVPGEWNRAVDDLPGGGCQGNRLGPGGGSDEQRRGDPPPAARTAISDLGPAGGGEGSLTASARSS